MVKKIFLIDDDPDDRELFCEAMEEIPVEITCYTASTGRRALAMLDDNEVEKPDLIFLDVNMPIMSGWQCLTLLKEKDEYKNIPVIMYSTSSHREDIDKALQLGAFCFYTKPPNYKDLKISLETMIGQLSGTTLPSLTQNYPPVGRLNGN